MSFSLIACQRINHYHPQFSINHKGMRALVEVMREVGIITDEYVGVWDDEDAIAGHIPAWKFAEHGTVTPEECTIIVRALENFRDANDSEWTDKVQEFFRFARGCVECGGFEVQ